MAWGWCEDNYVWQITLWPGHTWLPPWLPPWNPCLTPAAAAWAAAVLEMGEVEEVG